MAQQSVAPTDVDLLLTPLPNLQARAAAYCRRYQKAMSTVVMEERYVQLVKRWNLPPREPDVARLAWLPGAGALDRQDVNVYERRQIRADLLLVQLRDQRWWAFRDILEVNGHEEHGREDRLRKLFIQQTEDSQRQLQRINQASATFNLGRYYREVNLPTVGLMVLQPVYIPRFSFSAGAVNRVGDASCRVIAFSETTTPTLVRTMDQRNMPLTGAACVGIDGTVWRTRIELDGHVTARGVIEVEYGPHERVDVLVPRTMWEWYLPWRQDMYDPWGPTYIEALATYSNLRRFMVETSEEMK